ncbi:hypothetical protein CRUP_034573 [Coryphaenoides rupestris]|nr:hypothetical protein CRUP_034573 [Coryphaenoides rupestris]
MVRQLADSSTPSLSLFACCRDPDGPRGTALQALARRHPDVITVFQLDVTDLCSIKRCAQQVGSRVGPRGLNLLVNNAAVLPHGTAQSSDPELMLAAFNTNVLGPMNLTQELLPLLRAAARASSTVGMSCRKAAVLNISGLAGSIAATPDSYAMASMMPYRVSKAALNMLTTCSAVELQQEGILLVLLHPGWVRTDMGGEEADIDSPESVKGMLSVMDSLTEKHSGAFLDYKGESVPW